MTIYTIGHGRHSFSDFLELLRLHSVAFVVDVRSIARSRWPQFNRKVLEALLHERGIGYEHLPECGGKILAPPDDLAKGIERILELAAEMPIVLMCSESQPLSEHKLPRARCHRVGLLAAPLRKNGVTLLHILPNGRAITIDESKVPSPW